MSLPSAVHVSSIIKREASGDWETRSSVVFRIGSFAKYVYIFICILYSLFRLLFVFCFVQKKNEGVEARVVITERAGRTKSVSYLCFPLISDER